MCWISCRETSEPSVMPSSTSTVCVRSGDMVTGRRASAAMPTATIAPEISPPGRLSHRNSRPPAAPMTIVSSVPRILARPAMAEDIDAGIRLTPPYGKSVIAAQMRHAIAAMRGGASDGPPASSKIRKVPTRPSSRRQRLIRLCGSGLLALAAEFPALLAMQSLGLGFLRTFERGGGARFLGLLFRRRLGFGLGRLGLGRSRGLCGCGAHQQKGSHGGRGGEGGDLGHEAPRIESKGATVALRC